MKTKKLDKRTCIKLQVTIAILMAILLTVTVLLKHAEALGSNLQYIAVALWTILSIAYAAVVTKKE